MAVATETSLVAEDTPLPVHPYKAAAPEANTLTVAGSESPRIPAFWLFCFAEDSLAPIDLGQNVAVGLVSETGRVCDRLAAREGLARELFPAHADLWARWRAAVESVGRRYLKLDCFTIWDVYPPGEFEDALRSALGWFESRDPGHRAALFDLAGAQTEEGTGRAVSAMFEDESPEEVLVGQLVMRR